MPLPHQIATLLYAFNARDEVLLLCRQRAPNQGMWSPFGGKLDGGEGESPYACACREAREEIGLAAQPQDLHLTGLISEHGYEGQAHWLMFLFEIKPRLSTLPPVHAEGQFGFFSRENIESLSIPKTDRDFIWPQFWRHRGGFFAAYARVCGEASYEWTLEESVPSTEATATFCQALSDD